MTILLIVGIAAIGTGLGSHAQVPSSHQVTADLVLNGNVTQNPAWSEINVQVWGNYTALSEYLFAPENTQAPMLNDFQVHVNSPGNSTIQVMQGADVLSSATGWAWNHTLIVNTTYSGIVSITINVTSSDLQHTSSFHYILNFMTPVTYINYEHNKLNLLQQVPLTWVSEAFAAGAMAIYVISKLSRRLAIKPHVKAKHDEWGLIRSG